MKLTVKTKEFLKSWTLTEKIAAKQSPQPSLSSIHFVAADNKLILEATDLKISLRTIAEGVRIDEPGIALLPINPLGELLKKIDSTEITITTNETRGILTAGENTYQLPLYETDLFPDFPGDDKKVLFAKVPTTVMQRLFEEGTVAGSLTDDYPRYLSTCNLSLKENKLNVVSTDGHRLSLSQSEVEGNEEKTMLLPLDAIKEYQRFLNTCDAKTVEIYRDDTSLVWFNTPGTEYTLRRVESTFPNYDRLLNDNKTTSMEVNRLQLIAALERIDLLVRKNQRLVVLNLTENGPLKLLGRSQEYGEAVEHLEALITGESLIVGFNSGYLLDGLKAAHRSERVLITFNGSEGQTNIFRPNNEDFRYMTMPLRIQQDSYKI